MPGTLFGGRHKRLRPAEVGGEVGRVAQHMLVQGSAPAPLLFSLELLPALPFGVLPALPVIPREGGRRREERKDEIWLYS